MTEYRSCHSVEGELFFNHLNKVGYCCMLTPNGGQPVLYENYCGETINWDDFFEKREAHIELMKNGSSIPACKDCLWIRNKNWPERKRELRYILINVWVKCNLFCIYCGNHSDENVLNNTKEYNLIPVLKEMIEQKIITENTKIDIAGGESTLDKNFNELLSILIDSGIKQININTNATIFSPSISKGINKGVISIISSIDSGDRKMFEFVKKKDLWDIVWKNISEYSKAGKTVSTKYIIIPSVNDTKKQIKKFVLKSKKTGVNEVLLNIDLHWLRKNSDDYETMKKVIDLTKYFIKVATICKIKWQVWAHIEDLIKRYNILQPENEINIDFIFNKDVKINFLDFLTYLL